MSAFDRITQTTKALNVVTAHLYRVQRSATTAAHPEIDQLAAEVRDAIEAAARELDKLLSAFVEPIWAELPEGVREQCRAALSK